MPGGKLTPPKTSAKQLRIGANIHLDGLGEIEGGPIIRAFEDQVAVFEPCVSELSPKSEMVRVKASFLLEKNGLLTRVQILEEMPISTPFAKCFLKQIEQLDLGQQRKSRRGEMTVGTFYGDQKGGESWQKNYQQ